VRWDVHGDSRRPGRSHLFANERAGHPAGSERKLIVVEEEADRVRLIFRRYLDLGCVRSLRDDLLAQGVVSKRRVFDNGRTSGGLPFSRSALYPL